MPKCYKCPYYKWSDTRYVHCEGGKIGIPGKTEQNEFILRHCCDLEGWRRCSIAAALERYYTEKGP